MSKTLDRSRDFGSITPPWNGAVFSQDGYFFDGQGQWIEELEREYQHTEPRAPKKKGKKACKKAKAATEAPANGVDVVPLPSEPDGAPGDVSGDEINLAAWALQEEKYPWFNVTKAIRERFSVQVSNKADALDVLIREKVVTSEQIKALAG